MRWQAQIFAGIVATLPAAGDVPVYTGSFNGSCLEEQELKSLYLDGNLDQLHSILNSYKGFASSTEMRIPIPCWLPVAKYSAIAAIASEQDTGTAAIYFASLLKVNPKAEIFELGITLGIQNVFDEIKSEMRIQYDSEEMFRTRRIPPPAFGPPPSERARGMRVKYHDLRSIYALAVDTTSFAIIAKSLHGETDPAFKLFASDLIMRVGASLKTAKRMVGESEGRESEILSQESVQDWSDRLKTRIGSMEAKAQGPGSAAMQTTFGDKTDKDKKLKQKRLVVSPEEKE